MIHNDDFSQLNREPEETLKYEEFSTPDIKLSDDTNRFSGPILDDVEDSSTVNVSNKISIEDEFQITNDMVQKLTNPE